MTSVRMMISIKIMIRSRAPIRYIAQFGMPGVWTIIGAVKVPWVGAVGAGGVISIGAEGVGSGANLVVDGASPMGGFGGCAGGVMAGLSGGGVAIASGGESVVKAPAALQLLCVLELMALTFQ